MRIIVALPLLLAAACSVENDDRNDAVTLNYDASAVENVADDLGNAAQDAASELGNATRSAGDAIENEIDNIDVDIDINRNNNRTGNST